MRQRVPHKSGRTIRRKVWSLAPLAGVGKRELQLGLRRRHFPDGYGPCADAIHVAVQVWALEGRGACAATPARQAPNSAIVVRAAKRFD